MNKMRLPRVNVKALWHKTRAFESVHRHQILAGSAIIGSWTSLALMYQASPKIHKVIEDKRKELDALSKDDKDARKVVKKELVVGVAKEAVAPVGTALVSTAAMAGSAKVSTQRIAAYSALNAALDSSYKAYREKVKEMKGDAFDRRVTESVSKDKASRISVQDEDEIFSTGGGEIVCLDKWTGMKFRSSANAIQKAFNELSYQCQCEDYVTLNDLYDKMNVPPDRWPKLGDIIGWTSDNRKKGIIDIGFTAALDAQQKPVLVLEYDVEVIPYYRTNKPIRPCD